MISQSEHLHHNLPIQSSPCLTPPGNDLRVILRLRGTDDRFFNDFCLMPQKRTPPHLVFYCAVVTSEDTASVEFLQKNKPLWPLMKRQWKESTRPRRTSGPRFPKSAGHAQRS